MQIKPGDVVKLRAYGGKVIERRVVDVKYPKVYVCTDEAYRTAQITGKRPRAWGLTSVILLIRRRSKMAERDWQKDLERCKRATPGPWVSVNEIEYDGDIEAPNAGVCVARGVRAEDKVFIAEAREGWPAALEERARLEERVRELERELSEALLNVHANEKLWLGAKRRAEELEEENRKLQTALDMTIAKADQLSVQLAGCSVAALGAEERLRPTDYGWSPAYADVMFLRERMEEMEKKNRRLREAAAKTLPVLKGLIEEKELTPEKLGYECTAYAVFKQLVHILGQGGNNAALNGGEKGANKID